jgi:hypothetical protein
LLKLLLQFNNVIRGLEPRIHCTFEAISENDEQPVARLEALVVRHQSRRSETDEAGRGYRDGVNPG